MTDEGSLLRTVIDNPEDRGVRLVFADWLEDHGDRGAEVFRAGPELPRLLAGLRTTDMVPQFELQAHATAGRADLLAAAVRILEGTPTAVQPCRTAGVIGWTLEAIRELLARTPGLPMVDALLAVPFSPARVREFASRLAGCQAEDILVQTFERHGADPRLQELFACLTQEMVLRLGGVEGLRPVATFWDGVRRHGHPLGRLPLRLGGVETEVASYLPLYSPGGYSARQRPGRGAGRSAPRRATVRHADTGHRVRAARGSAPDQRRPRLARRLNRGD